MKRTLFQKVVCLLLSVTTLFGFSGIVASAGELKGNESTSATLDEMQALVSTNSYAEYIAPYADASFDGLTEIEIPINAFTGNGEIVADSEMCQNAMKADQTLWETFGDNAENSVYLPSAGSSTWHFNVPDAGKGLYNIRIEYYNPMTAESSISSTERKLYIDDRIPFQEAGYLKFSKSWICNNTVTETSSTSEPDGSDVVFETRSDGYYKIFTSIKNGVKTVETSQIAQDINGNSMAPEMAQLSKWSTYYCQDTTGYYNGYFDFYFLNGTHTLTLEAVREPMIVKSITLVPSDSKASLPSYADIVAGYQAKGYTAPKDGKMTTIEAEYPDYVSDSSVYATNDNTSACTYPITSKAQLYNVIGENSYNTVGQWSAYKFTVNESGLYKFGMRYKQDALQGMYICRTIKLSGGDYGLPDGTPTVPFAEAYNCQFNYSKKWQSNYIGDNLGNVFEFYFEKGVEYTVYFECSLGSLKELIQRVENSMNAVNDCYLRILQLTGNDPDEDRSYGFLSIMPDVLVEMLEQAIELEEVKGEFEILCGSNGSHINTLETIALMLDKMGSDDGENIAANMSNLKSYLGTLGTWINSSKQSSMMVDCITIAPSDADERELRRANANFFVSAWFEISSFIYSFFTDYDQMGLTTLPDENTETVSVWLATGRDQSSIWRSMIDSTDGYTESTGNAVTLKLITGGTLLPSILSGKGPDVYIGLGSADVINYAIRDAILGVSGNDTRLTDEENSFFSKSFYTYKRAEGDYEITETYKGDENLTFVSQPFDDVVSANFVPAAMDTVRLLGVTYGIPQTMSFAMMFYRMDVLADLGQEVPESWDQLLALLPVLQTNNMSIGLAYASAIDFMLYQRGGNMWKYTDNPQYAGAKIGLSEDVALEAFEYTCRLYTDYSFPVAYDAANRFRTGEMPLIIGDYAGLYNQLVVFATEIEGLWEFCSLPGTKRSDGTFNYDSLAGVSATVLLHGCHNYLAAWQFTQWQTSADVQANYGNKMVALIGPSAKYESANVNALRNLSWTASEKEAIEAQMNHLSSVVNYPGSYIIGRYTNFAFLDAVNDGANAIEALNAYVDTINAEIKRKREEFGLPTLEVDEEPPIVQAD